VAILSQHFFFFVEMGSYCLLFGMNAMMILFFVFTILNETPFLVISQPDYFVLDVMYSLCCFCLMHYL
jgi:hypothetical protein